MILRNKKTDVLRLRGAAAAAAVLSLLAGSLVSGCGPKDNATTDAAKGAGAGAAPGTAGAATPTPEQEAAKQKAIQQAPDIQAALQRQQQGN